jgi:DNA polymerase-3 subunit epsilon
VARLDGRILCAHNIEFDWPFLVRALGRAGYQPPDARRLCTLELSRALDADRVLSHRLPDLCARYGVTLTRAHDAAADAEATAAVLPPLFAAAGLRDLADLAPYLVGSSATWPPIAG